MLQFICFVFLLLQFVTVQALTVTKIAGGGLHSLFLKSDGSLWAMGFNGAGELGDGTYGSAPYDATNLPEQIVASGVTAIAAGGYDSLFLKNDGSLWQWVTMTMDSLVTALTALPHTMEQIVLNKQFPAASRQLHREAVIVCLLKVMAVYGAWA